jgi:hypothetical protein
MAARQFLVCSSRGRPRNSGAGAQAEARRPSSSTPPAESPHASSRPPALAAQLFGR